MNMTSYLPRKKILIPISILCCAALLFGAYVLVKKYISTDQNNDSSGIEISLVSGVNDQQDVDPYLDSDGDGLMDWEENLVPGLDPYLADSDGDGVRDDVYIERLYELTYLPEQDPEQPTISETEKFSLLMLSALATLDGTGEQLSESDQEIISENMNAYIQELQVSGKTYIKNDFSLIDTNYENSVAYKDAMAQILNSYPVSTSDFELIGLGAEEDNEEYLGKIQAAEIQYRRYLDELLQVEVPYVAARYHTQLVNAVAYMQAATKNLIQPEPDSVVKVAAIVQLDRYINQFSSAILGINNLFESIDQPDAFSN